MSVVKIVVKKDPKGVISIFGTSKLKNPLKILFCKNFNIY
jgi:hypothetical protein